MSRSTKTAKSRGKSALSSLALMQPVPERVDRAILMIRGDLVMLDADSVAD